MASRPVRALLAVALSAAAYLFGTGLEPVAWLTWLAPLPVLLLAARETPRVAAGASGTAFLLGELNLWTFLTGEIRMPVALVVGLLVASAGGFAGGVLLFRGLLVRGRPVAAVLALPALWVGIEYLFSISSPDGAWWSLAYTQVGVLPVVQVAALTGYWGITFLLLLVPSTVAALVVGPRTHRLRLGSSVAVLCLLVVGYGIARTAAVPRDQVQRVALVAGRHEHRRVDVATPEGRALLDGYVAEVRQLATDGARYVVLPETAFYADASTVGLVTTPLSTVARESGATIVVGVGTERNTAQILAPDGSVTDYAKRHLLPREPFTPGSEPVLTADAMAVAICKDLDFPGLVRDYRTSGARALLVPAWDFAGDAWLRSRIAVLRGVEYGLPVLRSTRTGVLTVSDTRGRVLAETRTGSAAYVSVVADVSLAPVSTMPTLLGPWFAWLCLVLLAGVVLLRLRRPRPASNAHPVEPRPQPMEPALNR